MAGLRRLWHPSICCFGSAAFHLKLTAVGAVGTAGKRSLFFHGFHSPVFCSGFIRPAAAALARRQSGTTRSHRQFLFFQHFAFSIQTAWHARLATQAVVQLWFVQI